jgi:hypothetical protein
MNDGTASHGWRIFAPLILFLTLPSASGQQTVTFTNKIVTFTNLQGRTFKNVELVRAYELGVVYRAPEGGGLVPYGSLSPSLLKEWGLRERIEPTNSPALVAGRPGSTLFAGRPGSAPQPPYDSIANHKFLVETICTSDFPQTEKAQLACREIASELKALRKSLELGTSYNSFSELLQSKALSVERIKDLRGGGLPHTFLWHVDECVDNYNRSRKEWKESIEAEYSSVKKLCDYYMRGYWSQAELHLLYCIGIADKDQDLKRQVVAHAASIILAEQDAARDPSIDMKYHYDSTLAGLTAEQIAGRLEAALANTNTPPTVSR